MTDVMKQLRDADPARPGRLDAVDEAVFAALRDDIATTSTRSTADLAEAPAPTTSRRRRVGRRGAVAIGLAAVLTGGGVAYAAVHLFQGATGEGLTCVRTWNADTAAGQHVDAAGSWRTGDPYADCTTLLAEQGLPPIDDPVAFAWDGQTVVAPADQVPDGVERLEGSQALGTGVVELRRTVEDVVDGGRGECRTVAEGAAWAQGEVDRLGLQDWTVVEQPGTEGLPCSDYVVDVQDRQLTVSASEDPYQRLSTPEMDAMTAALRERIVDRCVSLDKARAVVDDVFAPVDFEFPTTDVVDESAGCARVDVLLGGTIDVTVYGPSTAR
ncbi:hypothetical protein [Isoptericola sp. NPDC057191]|uniref:hypothetical protein n=1 Tax=Isoptericola sp. NPDC057191 TaxID=3346041 RepID=UPI003640855F